jgi:N-acetylmuramoyl-L-alanine amidase
MKLKVLIILLLFTIDIVIAQDFKPLLFGKTIGQLPSLKYGPGEDRLGGAKMTYLDTCIVMQIVDSTKDDFIVQLSKNHKAFIPKNNIQAVTDFIKPAYTLTSSWTVYGDEKYDYVNIGLEGKLPYTSIQQINPTRLVVDIFGATSNSNWITQLRSVKEIKNVNYEQREDDVFRVIIDLKHEQHWGYFISYKKNSLSIRIKRQPEKLRIQNLFIAIDAGHGGTSTGANGVMTNINEKDLNLKIAKELEKYLTRRHIKTFMTRTEDKDIGMVERTLMLRQEDPNILISIHNNSSSNAEIKGPSTYYRYIGFRPLSEAILKRMLELKLGDFNNIGGFNFALSGPTEYPNCLVEVAFMSNVENEKRMLEPGFPRDVTKKIFKGIKDWLKEID